MFFKLGKLSAVFPDEFPKLNEDLWHPHLKKNWVDEKDYTVVDHHSKVYQTYLSLLQLSDKSGDINIDKSSEVKNLITNQKLACGCRFLKNLNKKENFLYSEKTTPNGNLLLNIFFIYIANKQKQQSSFIQLKKLNTMDNSTQNKGIFLNLSIFR